MRTTSGFLDYFNLSSRAFKSWLITIESSSVCSAVVVIVKKFPPCNVYSLMLLRYGSVHSIEEVD